jgi:UDP-N-acetylglucosamine 2-epimerase
MKCDEKDKSQPQNRREFDAYISYSHYDITWVKEFHDNLESMGFILCLDEKIFIVGNPIGENIIQAIDSSRKVIFIITEFFFL